MSAVSVANIAPPHAGEPAFGLAELAGDRAAAGSASQVEPKLVRSGIAADELADLVRSFTEVTERLQTTHSALQTQVGQLQAELAEANEQLRRSRELAALGEMAAGIAHEIRNPLGSIALDVEMLREDFRGETPAMQQATAAASPEQARICDRILRAVERLDHIVGDVLRFARDLKVQPIECDASDILDAALASCDAPIKRGGVTVERSCDADGVVMADRHLIAQALTNLIRNAVEAMSESDRSERSLRVSSRRSRKALPDGRRAEHVIFRIEDSGPGVPDELVERIFHPFFTTRSEGTGLGLAIVHRIIDAHGGSIAVHNVPATTSPTTSPTMSKGPASPAGGVAGARFEIALPVKGAQRSTSRRPGRTPAERAEESGLTGHGKRHGRGDGLNEAVRRRIGPLAS